jgi:hypothetical protein
MVAVVRIVAITLSPRHFSLPVVMADSEVMSTIVLPSNTPQSYFDAAGQNRRKEKFAPTFCIAFISHGFTGRDVDVIFIALVSQRHHERGSHLSV